MFWQANELMEYVEDAVNINTKASKYVKNLEKNNIATSQNRT